MARYRQFASGLLVSIHPEGPPTWATSSASVVSWVAPGVSGIAQYSSNPAKVSIVIALQWLFLIWYLAVWFYRFAPWQARIRDATRKKAASLRAGQRGLFVIGYCVLFAYVLGDVQLIGFPTLLNGRFAASPDAAALVLRPIYRSSVALLIYAWASPFLEATILWMFANFTFNVSSYLGVRKS